MALFINAWEKLKLGNGADIVRGTTTNTKTKTRNDLMKNLEIGV